MANISREQFDETKGVQRKIIQAGTLVTDADLNEQFQAALSLDRRSLSALTKHVDVRFGDGFKIEGNGSGSVTVKAGLGAFQVGNQLAQLLYIPTDTSKSGFSSWVAARTDYLYVDVFFDQEIDASADPNIVNPDIGEEAARDIRTTFSIEISNGGPPSAPPAGHVYVNIATVTKTSGTNIAAGDVTVLLSDHYAPVGSITATQLASDSVTTAKIVDVNVTGAKIADGSIVNSKLAADAVDTIKILDAAVSSPKLATDAVTQSKIAAGAVGTAEIGTGAVATANIADGAIQDLQIDPNIQIDATKISAFDSSGLLDVTAAARIVHYGRVIFIEDGHMNTPGKGFRVFNSAGPSHAFSCQGVTVWATADDPSLGFYPHEAIGSKFDLNTTVEDGRYVVTMLISTFNTQTTNEPMAFRKIDALLQPLPPNEIPIGFFRVSGAAGSPMYWDVQSIYPSHNVQVGVKPLEVGPSGTIKWDPTTKKLYVSDGLVWATVTLA